MKVSNLCTHDPVVVLPGQNLSTAAMRMVAHSIGALVVVRASRPIGIITERDITAAVADDADPVLTTVARYMTADPATVGADDDTQVAAERMLQLRVRHLPVVDEIGAVVGMVSARDLLILHQWPAIGRSGGSSGPMSYPQGEL